MPVNVLITAASRRVALVEAFRRALSALQVPGRIVVTDVNALSPAVHAADRAYRVPLATAPSYLEAVWAVCSAEAINVIVPTIDDELPLFARARARFAAAGVSVVVSPPRTVDLCNDKYATCRTLAAHGVAAAASYLPSELPSGAPTPAFIKPRYGRGGIGAFQARNRRELDFFLEYVESPVVQEYLTGPEFTIDMLCDVSGRPLSIVPRERLVIRAGISDRGRTTQDPALVDLALACADAFTFVGPVNIQCRVHAGRPTVFEINPRFSGGLPLTIAAGADFPRMILEIVLGRAVPPAIGRFQADVWMTSFESSVFVGPDHVLALHPVPPRPAVRDVA